MRILIKNPIFFRGLAYLMVLAVSLGFLSGCTGTDTSELKLMREDEEIITISQGLYMICAVTNLGNCYVAGQSVTEDCGFGLSDIKAYNEYFNLFEPDRFVQIYGGGDATSVYLNSWGGCIFTENQNMFLFLNDGKSEYRTPKYFCSNCVDAQITRFDTIYLLLANGDFGYVPIDSPSDFHLIESDVKKFRCVMDKNEETTYFVLKNDNRLYAFGSEEPSSERTQYIGDVIDFDLQTSSGEFAFSLIDSNHDAYHSTYDGIWQFSFDKIQSNLGLIGNDISSVISYDLGTVMIGNDGEIRLYGTDMDDYVVKYTGEKVFENKKVKDICATFNSLTVLTEDNMLHKFGFTLDGIVPITSEL